MVRNYPAEEERKSGMHIFITDSGMIWNHENPYLEKFRDIVTVVCLNGKKVTDKYDCFVSPYVRTEDNNDQYGMTASKYVALESVTDKLLQRITYHEDNVFLADWNPESLYPFSVIRNRTDYTKIHLCGMSPMLGEKNEVTKAFDELLADLSGLSTFMYMDTKRTMLELFSSNVNVSLTEANKALTEYWGELLTHVLNGIHKCAYRKAFYDFSTNSYVPINKGFSKIDSSHPAKMERKIEFPLEIEWSTIGRIASNYYPSGSVYSKESVGFPVPRIDGKEICTRLRKQRIRLAEANGITFFSSECPSVGPCAGTCEKCDTEAKYLMHALDKISEEKRVYPQFDPKGGADND